MTSVDRCDEKSQKCGGVEECTSPPPAIIENFQFSQVTRADFIYSLRFFCEIFLQILLYTPPWVLRAATVCDLF